MSTFNLDYEYDLYLSRVGLDKKKMDKSHRRETKRAFMAGAGSVLAMLGDIADMNEADAMAVLSRVKHDVAEYWVREATNSN
ncbi:hypothetical protein [Parapedobacter indicus]|uniref:Uncharacterized protein n=1 Tax=Parapedobacter indicus TaxID=1477437 RepID=A0A1I3E3G6_9SPHI|nr:hypothetical protein [Parapedobacter indicus]PPL04943.1 hypothetical protein CLV26_101753 [Parapedobacter indicus]SFH93241.1 hypothetical protein SAMN05444682_101739 [Parapedobacter indicus]